MVEAIGDYIGALASSLAVLLTSPLGLTFVTAWASVSVLDSSLDDHNVVAHIAFSAALVISLSTAAYVLLALYAQRALRPLFGEDGPEAAEPKGTEPEAVEPKAVEAAPPDVERAEERALAVIRLVLNNWRSSREADDGEVAMLAAFLEPAERSYRRLALSGHVPLTDIHEIGAELEMARRIVRTAHQ